jgi:hypothetical protein
MKFLVRLMQTGRHHKAFCGIGKPLLAQALPQEKGLRGCRSPLLEGSVVMCADLLYPVRALRPVIESSGCELSSPVMESSSAKTTTGRECSDFSRRVPKCDSERTANSQGNLAGLPLSPDPGTDAARGRSAR